MTTPIPTKERPILFKGEMVRAILGRLPCQRLRQALGIHPRPRTMGRESLGVGYRVSEATTVSYPILGKGVSKRLGPAVNIITRFNTFRPSAYYPLRDELGRGRWYYSKELLSIGYRHTGKNIVWGQTISEEQGLQLLFNDLLQLESNLNRELPWFHQWHYLVRAAVISRAFHEGSYFFSGKMGIAMGGGPWGTLNGSHRPSLCLEECLSSQWEHLNDKQKELRIAELDLVYLKDELMELKEKEKTPRRTLGGHSEDTTIRGFHHR